MDAGTHRELGLRRDADSAPRRFVKVETSEELCRQLGFPDPEKPKCDESRYARCIPALFCGEELLTVHEGRAGGAMKASCPVAWIATANLKQPKDATVWELRHVDGDGQETVTSVTALAPPDCKNPMQVDDHLAGDLNPQFLFDYDGDGEPELLFRQYGGPYSVDFPGVVLTVKEGVARVYFAPPTGYHIDDTSDYDHDKVPDLELKILVGGDWEEGCGGYGEPQWSSRFIAHARADGKFDMSDKVAADAVREWCRRKPGKVESQEDTLCALLWRASPRALERKFKRQLRACEQAAAEVEDSPDECTDVDRCNVEKAQLALARWQPPFFLDARPSN